MVVSKDYRLVKSQSVCKMRKQKKYKMKVLLTKSDMFIKIQTPTMGVKK